MDRDPSLASNFAMDQGAGAATAVVLAGDNNPICIYSPFITDWT